MQALMFPHLSLSFLRLFFLLVFFFFLWFIGPFSLVFSFVTVFNSITFVYMLFSGTEWTVHALSLHVPRYSFR